MQPKSMQERPTTGVPVDEVIISLIVTARTKGLNFNQWPLPLKKLKQFIYAAVRDPKIPHFAMVATINKPVDVRTVIQEYLMWNNQLLLSSTVGY